MEENHSDTESTQILGDWDFILTLSPHAVEGTREEREGGSTSCAAARGEGEGGGRGRVLPPWADPSYEWGDGKYKEDGRKNKNKEKEKDRLLEEELMNEYSSLPPQIAEWYWCIEYVAKFLKDLPLILDVMNMGYPHPSTNDYGSRINEILSLRILESLFDPTKFHHDSAAPVVGPRIDFDFSLSNTHVLYSILEHIPLSELRPGMPELSKFNPLPFIAHKNMSLPLCALEKLRDISAMESRTSAAASPIVDPVYYRDDDQPKQQSRTGLEQTNMNDDDDRVQTNEGDKVIVIDGNDTSAEQQPINSNCNATRETSSPSSDVRLKCTKDTGLVNNIPPRSENRWKCSRSECATKVHKECSSSQVHFDEHDNFLCPVCWYDRIAMESIESDKLMLCAERNFVKFLPLLSRPSK